MDPGPSRGSAGEGEGEETSSSEDETRLLRQDHLGTSPAVCRGDAGWAYFHSGDPDVMSVGVSVQQYSVQCKGYNLIGVTTVKVSATRGTTALVCCLINISLYTGMQAGVHNSIHAYGAHEQSIHVYGI
jgi:hypothetical protein